MRSSLLTTVCLYLSLPSCLYAASPEQLSLRLGPSSPSGEMAASSSPRFFVHVDAASPEQVILQVGPSSPSKEMAACSRPRFFVHADAPSQQGWWDWLSQLCRRKKPSSFRPSPFSPSLWPPQLLDLIFARHPQKWPNACLERRREILKELEAKRQTEQIEQDNALLRQILLHCFCIPQYNRESWEIADKYHTPEAPLGFNSILYSPDWTVAHGEKLLEALAADSDGFYYFMEYSALLEKERQGMLPPSLQMGQILADFFFDHFPDKLRGYKETDPILAGSMQDIYQKGIADTCLKEGNAQLYDSVVRVVMDYAVHPLYFLIRKEGFQEWLEGRRYLVDAAMHSFLQALEVGEVKEWEALPDRTIEYEEVWTRKLLGKPAVPPMHHPLYLARRQKKLSQCHDQCHDCCQKPRRGPLRGISWRCPYYTKHGLLTGWHALMLWVDYSKLARQTGGAMGWLDLLVVPCYVPCALFLIPAMESNYACVYTTTGYPALPCIKRCRRKPLLPACLSLCHIGMLTMIGLQGIASCLYALSGSPAQPLEGTVEEVGPAAASPMEWLPGECLPDDIAAWEPAGFPPPALQDSLADHASVELYAGQE